jgi:hypothetical protein
MDYPICTLLMGLLYKQPITLSIIDEPIIALQQHPLPLALPVKTIELLTRAEVLPKTLLGGSVLSCPPFFLYSLIKISIKQKGQ